MRAALLVFIGLLLAACQTIEPQIAEQTAAEPTTATKQTGIQLDIERWQTAQGTEVLFVQNSQLPMVDIRLRFDAGSMRDAELSNGLKDGQHGLSQLVISMLGEATSLQNAQQISEAFEQQGAIFKVDAGKTSASISLRSLTGEPLNKSLAQLQHILKDTRFNADDFARIKAQMVNYLRYVETNPSTQVTRFYNDLMFGKHPLAHDDTGTLASIEAISLEDLQAFWQRYYTQANMTLAITGDLNLTEAKQIASSIAETRPVGAALAARPALPRNKQQEGVKHKQFNSTQAHILLGMLTVGRDDSRYAALKLATEILGGGSTSRLYQVIREEQGLSYSVYSRYSPLLKGGEFYISLQTAADQQQQALTATLDVLNKFIEQGVTEEELAQAKASYRLSFAQAFTSNGSINGYLALMGYEDLPNNYLTDFMQRLNDTTVEQVNQAIKALINPDNLLITTLGPNS